MILTDKFDIIIGKTKEFPKDDKTIGNYFENLIKNDQKIYISRFIFDSIDNSNCQIVVDLIQQHLNDYIKDIRKNIRSNLKRNPNINLLDTYINIINKYKGKIYQLEYYLPNRINFKTECYTNFLSKVISDPLILSFLIKDIMNVNNKLKLKDLTNIIKKMDLYYLENSFISFIKKSIDTFILEDFSESTLLLELVDFYNFISYLDFLSVYLKNFEFFEQKEKIFSSQVDKILDLITKSIINNNFERLIKLFSNEKVIKPLNLLFKNTSSIKFEDFSVKVSLEIINKFNKEKSFDNLFSFYSIISGKYLALNSISIILCKEISNIIAKEDLYSVFNEKLMYILSNDKSEESNYLFHIISYLDDKTFMFKNYHKNLMIRLLDNKINSKDLENEKNRIVKLGKCFNMGQRHKLNKTVKDVEYSINKNNNIIEIIQKKDAFDSLTKNNFNIIITSYNTWDTPVLENNYITLEDKEANNPLIKLLKFYSIYFSRSEENKEYLNWYLHTGFVKMEYSTFHSHLDGPIKLKLLPIQALILEKFDYSVEFIRYSEFKKLDIMSSYSENEKDILLDVFIDSNILKLKGDKIVLNMDLRSKEEISLIDLYFEASSLPEEWNKIIEIEIANDKIDVVKCKINHYLKQKDYDYLELFNECKSINVFELDNNLFSEAITYLDDHDFIDVDKSGNCKKLLY